MAAWCALNSERSRPVWSLLRAALIITGYDSFGPRYSYLRVDGRVLTRPWVSLERFGSSLKLLELRIQLLGKITVRNFWISDSNFGSGNPCLYSCDNYSPQFCSSVRNFVNFLLFLLFRAPFSFTVHGFEIVIHDLVSSLQILRFPTSIVQEISQTPCWRDV
jgi:hypothetical protein